MQKPNLRIRCPVLREVAYPTTSPDLQRIRYLHPGLLADIREFEDMNKVYRKFMPDPKPVRATVQVGSLVDNARIEISAIAVRQQ